MHYARGMRKMGKGRGSGHAAGSKPHLQRCAARVTYLNNRTRGQWRAHGRYLARESATAGNSNEMGFNRDRAGIDVARELERWQSSEDPRLWKVILSPEFGDRVDLQRLARDLVERMAVDLGTTLEWVAVAHYNTEHPHVHMVMRGIRSDGQPLQFRREYLKYGIREITEDLCTRQIGYRTLHDAAEAERREISEKRFTSLDRAILRDADQGPQAPDSAKLTVVKNPVEAGLADSARSHSRHIVSRLAVLQRMGLAEPAGANTWHVRRDFEQILRAMQRTTDRQRTLAAHGISMSDDRLPIDVLDVRTFTAVEGRILVHGQDEQAGRSYLMLDGTDAKVHFIQYTSEMELLRADGELRTNSFLRLRRLAVDGEPVFDIQDLGDSERLLKNRALMRENARALLKRGVVPTEDGWGGWLGRYQTALAGVAREMTYSSEPQLATSPGRSRDQSRGAEHFCRKGVKLSASRSAFSPPPPRTGFGRQWPFHTLWRLFLRRGGPTCRPAGLINSRGGR
jgi:type IV secretory pathway VirD2 relaxase